MARWSELGQQHNWADRGKRLLLVGLMERDRLLPICATRERRQRWCHERLRRTGNLGFGFFFFLGQMIDLLD